MNIFFVTRPFEIYVQGQRDKLMFDLMKIFSLFLKTRFSFKASVLQITLGQYVKSSVI